MTSGVRDSSTDRRPINGPIAVLFSPRLAFHYFVVTFAEKNDEKQSVIERGGGGGQGCCVISGDAGTPSLRQRVGSIRAHHVTQARREFCEVRPGRMGPQSHCTCRSVRVKIRGCDIQYGCRTCRGLCSLRMPSSRLARSRVSPT